MKLSIQHFNTIDEVMGANNELLGPNQHEYSKSDFTLQYQPKLFSECGGNLAGGGAVQRTASAALFEHSV